MNNHSKGPAPEPHNDYRDREIRMRPVFLFALILLVVMAVVFVAMFVELHILSALEDRAEPQVPALAEQRQLPPGPRLQTEPAWDLAQLRAYEDTLMTNTVMLDATGAMVRIPVRRAMEIIAHKNLPHREPAAPITGAEP